MNAILSGGHMQTQKSNDNHFIESNCTTVAEMSAPVPIPIWILIADRFDLHESNLATVVEMSAPVSIPIWILIADRFDLHFALIVIVIIGLGLISIAVAALRVGYVKYWKKQFDDLVRLSDSKQVEFDNLSNSKQIELYDLEQRFERLDKKYKRILDVLDNNATIRDGNIAEIVKHLKVNLHSKKFARIITNPERQLEKIRHGFEYMVLGFCNCNAVDRSVKMAYRIRDYDEDGKRIKGSNKEKWQWIYNSTPMESNCFDDENTADSFAQDNETTFYHAINEDWFHFYPCKKDAIENGKYKKVKRDGENLEDIKGSIIAFYVPILDRFGNTCVEGVVSLSTYDKPLVADIDKMSKKDIERVKRMLYKIAKNYSRKMKSELMLYIMNAMKKNNSKSKGNASLTNG